MYSSAFKVPVGRSRLEAVEHSVLSIPICSNFSSVKSKNWKGVRGLMTPSLKKMFQNLQVNQELCHPLFWMLIVQLNWSKQHFVLFQYVLQSDLCNREKFEKRSYHQVSYEMAEILCTFSIVFYSAVACFTSLLVFFSQPK